MATLVYTDCKIYMAGYNLSGQSNNCSVEYGAEMLDATVFSSGGTRINKAGLKTAKIMASGFQDYGLGTPEAEMFTRIGAVAEVFTIAPTGNAEAERAFTLKGVSGTYQILPGEVGSLLPFEIDAIASHVPLVRGSVFGVGLKAVSGNGVGENLGVVAADHRIFSALHVVSALGTLPTLDVVIESAASGAFTTPTTRLTHAQMTGIGSNWQEADGPGGTDAYWRAKWTIGGTTPSFIMFLVVGVL